MTLKLYIFILFIILISSLSSASLLFVYMNPESNMLFALWLMGISLLLSSSSILTFIIFFVKKIYYRGDVHLSTMNSSLRQAILISLGVFSTIGLYSLEIGEMRLILMVWAAVMCFEVMMQAIE